MISICIPAYKNPDYISRLLDSIAIQTFTDFEVIVSDDSPDFDIEKLCTKYKNSFQLSYFRNTTPLGSPENWNEAVRRAGGEWIKIMHDDDWFTDRDSLQTFADAITAHPEENFFFSAWRRVTSSGNKTDIRLSGFRYKTLLRDPVTLFADNCIGPPSAVLYRKRDDIIFDKRLKWVVDFEFYIHYLSGSRPVYIDQILINFGVHDQQITSVSFRNAQVEIPEYFQLLEKVGVDKLKNIRVYDAWWRLIRNLGIKNSEDIRKAGYPGTIPDTILAMIGWQRRMPGWLLKNSFFSKTGMSISYSFSRWI
jgi:glycosyltransferase involved in cell wall biosynthesis